MSDLPLLTAAGAPVAVNPDRRLRREARSQGWPVLTF
jgi:phosphoserine phosphatase